LGLAPNAAFQVRQESREGPWHTRAQHQYAGSARLQAFTSDPINRPHGAVGSVLSVFAQFVESDANDYLPDCTRSPTRSQARSNPAKLHDSQVGSSELLGGGLHPWDNSEHVIGEFQNLEPGCNY